MLAQLEVEALVEVIAVVEAMLKLEVVAVEEVPATASPVPREEVTSGAAPRKVAAVVAVVGTTVPAPPRVAVAETGPSR